MANQSGQSSLADANKAGGTSEPAATSPVVPTAEQEKLSADQAKLAADRKALEDEKAKFEAEKGAADASAKTSADQAEAPKLSKDEKAVLKLIGESKRIDAIVQSTGVARDDVIRIAENHMNNQSLYQLAEKLGTTVNDIFRATGRDKMVRYKWIEEIDDNGNEVKKKVEEDYTEI